MSGMAHRSDLLTRDELDEIRTASSTSPITPFLVTVSEYCPPKMALDVHVARETAKALFTANSCARLVRNHFAKSLRSRREQLAIRVRVHSAAALGRPQSLEAFVSAVAVGERVYDPTGVFEEADRLIRFASALRSQRQIQINGVYWNSRLRTVYVLLHEESFVDRAWLLPNRLIAAERVVACAFEASAQRASEKTYRVRLGFEIPPVPLVPIDAASSAPRKATGFRLAGLPPLHGLATLARVPMLGALVGVGSAASAAASVVPREPPPIVSGIDDSAPSGRATRNLPGNAKAHLDDQHRNSDAAHLPGAGRGDAFVTEGLHMLWRDPIRGTIGRNASYAAARSAQRSPDAAGPEQPISRAKFIEISALGGRFGRHESAAVGRQLDLGWLPSGGPDAADRPPGLSALRSGVAAIPGLSLLAGDDPSDEAYEAILQHLPVYFGLPVPLQEEMLRHVGSSRTPSPRSGDVSPRRVLIAQASSYWDWLKKNQDRATGPRSQPRNSGPDPYRNGRTDCSSC